MKRSAVITLLGIGAGAAMLQSQFGNTDSESQREAGTVYKSKEQCAAAGAIAKDDCEKGWLDAQKDHEANAPHYATMADCENIYGAGMCMTPTTLMGSPASYVIPAMMGYMIGRSWGQSGCRAAPLYRRPADPKDRYMFSVPGSCTGAYASSSSGATTSSGGHYGGYHSTGYTRTSTTRGGFGSTGRGFSGFSGS